MLRQSFIYGALILLAAGLINRAMGFAYQVMMIRLIKPEGVGLFNMAYPIYILIIVIASAGIPLAVAKLVAEEVARSNLRGAYRILALALFFTALISTFLTVMIVITIPAIHKYIFPNPKVYYCFLCLVPGIIIVPICSVFRGFFQGLQQMTPTAVSQIVEQTVRITSGLLIAMALLPRGIEYATIGISAGVVLGELTGLFVMLALFFSKRPATGPCLPRYPTPLGSIAKRMFSLSIPVTLTRVISTVFMSIEAILIPRRLQDSGMGLAEATSTYGQFVGISLTLLFVPNIFTAALATSLLPAVSDAQAQDNPRLISHRTEEALRLAILSGLPATILFLLLPGPICESLFGYAQAGNALSILAVGATFLYLQQTTTAVLQGMGEASLPFRNLFISSLIKLTGIYFLTSVPHLNIRGTAAAISSSFFLTAVLNYWDLTRLTGLKPDLTRCLLKPLTAATGMFFTIQLFKAICGSTLIELTCATSAGLAAYIFILLRTGGLDGQDMEIIKRTARRVFFKNRKTLL